ncbi:MAG: UDP-glucose 4-epimerase family protein [Syntrophobacteraceae bacterium]
MADSKKNRTILVTGASGFIGSHLCCELLRRGSSVLAANRAESQQKTAWENLTPDARLGGMNPLYSSTVSVGEIGPQTDWSCAFTGVDAAVHLAARVHIMRDSVAEPLLQFRKVNVEGTRRLANAAAEAGVKRFVFLSSIKVHGESTGNGRGPFCESDPPHPEDNYGLSKLEAERALREVERETGMEVTIIRPPLVYGPGVKANFLNLVRLVERGMPLPLRGVRNQRSLLGLTNIVDLICRCLEHPGAAGETFLASDGEDVSTPELVRRIAKALRKNARLISVPEWLMRAGSAVTGRSKEFGRICGSLQIDSSRVRRLLDWVPPSTMPEELSRLAAWRAECGGARKGKR